jgi:hypothetical protein
MEINTPSINSIKTPEERLREIERYLFYLAQQLNYIFNDIELTLTEIQKSIGGKQN